MITYSDTFYTYISFNKYKNPDSGSPGKSDAGPRLYDECIIAINYNTLYLGMVRIQFKDTNAAIITFYYWNRYKMWPEILCQARTQLCVC